MEDNIYIARKHNAVHVWHVLLFSSYIETTRTITFIPDSGSQYFSIQVQIFNSAITKYILSMKGNKDEFK